LRGGQAALGGWMLVGHPAIAELMAGEGFDWICVDLEHAPTSTETLYSIVLAAKGTGCDVLARLHSCDPVLAKTVLDAGCAGIIVPSVNTPAQAARAVAMAKFPPDGFRGASLCRASDFGRKFGDYYAGHNQRVLVAVMIEHIDAVTQVDAILATPGVDAAFIGPYDLSASMGLAGQVDHPQVLAAQERVLASCLKHGVAPGIHVVSPDGDQLAARLAAGYRFIACGLDTLFIMNGCRSMLAAAKTAAPRGA